MTKRHILVVEDDRAFRSLVVRMLKRGGYLVSEADGYAAALDAVEHTPAIELLVVDIGMPAGTPHGVAIGKMSRSRRTQLKVVYMTGGDAEAVIGHADGAPVLQKPFTADVLLATIERAMT
jgi:DNA-binding NtrC family response regulator